MTAKVGSRWYPTPASRELTERLIGVRLPAAKLPFALDVGVSLAALARRRSLIVFFYPGLAQAAAAADQGAGRAGERAWHEDVGLADEDADDDTVRAVTWREYDTELNLLGYLVVGVSTQSPEEQVYFAARELIGYMLLSDADLQLAHALDLPTSTVNEVSVYEPLTLIVQDERIARVFYPVAPALDAPSVSDWVQQLQVQP